jgi:hypothetical protein
MFTLARPKGHIIGADDIHHQGIAGAHVGYAIEVDLAVNFWGIGNTAANGAFFIDMIKQNFLLAVYYCIDNVRAVDQRAAGKVISSPPFQGAGGDSVGLSQPFFQFGWA